MTNPQTEVVSPGRHAAYFDEMCWPTAGEANGDIAYELIHGEPTREQMIRAATIIEAYQELVWCPRAKREHVVRRLRGAEAWPELKGYLSTPPGPGADGGRRGEGSEE